MSNLEDVEKIIKLLNPIINKHLLQTQPQRREDLKQEIIIGIIEKLKKEEFKVPGFFDMLDQIKYTDKKNN